MQTVEEGDDVLGRQRGGAPDPALAKPLARIGIEIDFYLRLHYIVHAWHDHKPRRVPRLDIHRDGVELNIGIEGRRFLAQP